MTLPESKSPALPALPIAIGAGESGMLRIDLDAIAGNWRALAQRVAPAACAAVVKADAYGLGLARVLPVLSAAGCETYFVATPREAADARALDGQARIFVLDGLFPGRRTRSCAREPSRALRASPKSRTGRRTRGGSERGSLRRCTSTAGCIVLGCRRAMCSVSWRGLNSSNRSMSFSS